MPGLHLCAWKPRCPNLTAGRYCDTHQQDGRQHERRYHAGPGVNYGRPWRRARARYFAEHPWCAACLLEHVRALATDLDHIEDHLGDPVKFWDESNWQGLCERHHGMKTARTMASRQSTAPGGASTC